MRHNRAHRDNLICFHPLSADTGAGKHTLDPIAQLLLAWPHYHPLRPGSLTRITVRGYLDPRSPTTPLSTIPIFTTSISASPERLLNLMSELTTEHQNAMKANTLNRLDLEFPDQPHRAHFEILAVELLTTGATQATDELPTTA